MRFVAPPPAVKLPLFVETVSQTEVLPSDQLKTGLPALVSENVCADMLNGPPTGPLATNPRPGVI